ncbi:hypothetical protein [Sphingobium algorifonticola]|uniref:Uncharacterized protein n=1 Tax=Sphingobium algorifonticola TaxID=2008318 RepID=A0A437J9U8_9SPHN|nr:hypothetical protein [Sphingobium algorifonticola]RVT42150.1 hypothetical protein ENE74_08010 [Sphingobium algorifonticola]
MSIAWDTTVRFFPGNREPGFRCTFRGCVALFAGMSPEERFAAYARFEQPVLIDGRHFGTEIGARDLETLARLLERGLH